MGFEIEKGFEIILHAGNAKCIALEIINLAEEGELDAAHKKIEKADEELVLAHQVHKDILDLLANGQRIDMDLILTHALDHLASAELICLLAQKFISIYEKIGGK